MVPWTARARKSRRRQARQQYNHGSAQMACWRGLAEFRAADCFSRLAGLTLLAPSSKTKRTSGHHLRFAGSQNSGLRHLPAQTKRKRPPLAPAVCRGSLQALRSTLQRASEGSHEASNSCPCSPYERDSASNRAKNGPAPPGAGPWQLEPRVPLGCRPWA